MQPIQEENPTDSEESTLHRSASMKRLQQRGIESHCLFFFL